MSPLVSIILPVKNAMPHLRAAIESIRKQTYRHFELIVEDGVSTDGTLEYLHSVTDIPSLSVTSAPDSGIGHAYSRGVQRCHGDYVWIFAADEMLEPHAIETALQWQTRRPDAIFVNGSARLIGSDGATKQIFKSPRFDLLAHMRCEVVLAFAGLLNRKLLGDELYYDASLKTCPDYDFWIRLGTRFDASQFLVVDEVFKTALADRSSMSFRVESYEQFCRDKQLVLDRFLGAQPRSAVTDAIGRTSRAGIHLWVAESILELQGPSREMLEHSRAAARLTPWAPRLAALGRRSKAFTLDPLTSELRVRAHQGRPTTATTVVPDAIHPARAYVDASFHGSRVVTSPQVEVFTNPSPWSFSAVIPFADGSFADRSHLHWVRLRVKVESGQVGFGLLKNADTRNERIVTTTDGELDIYIRVDLQEPEGIVIRNGAVPGESRVRIIDAAVEKARPQDL
jgi:hypothetical protein